MPDKRFQAWQKSTIRGRCPLINPQKRKTWRQKRKIKNNTEEKTSASSFLSVSITLRSSPRQSLSRGPEVSKKQRKSKSMDSRLKISGMTKKEGRHPWTPLPSRCLSFLSVSIRNLNYLRAKASGFPIKDFGNDCGGGFPPKFQAWRRGGRFPTKNLENDRERSLAA